MSKNQTLSLRTQWLGERLKAARVAAGLKLREAADQLQLAEGTLSRFEHGALHIRRPYLKELIDFYGVANRRERDALIRLNEDAWRKDWWDGDTDDLETGFVDYTWLESRAARICQFETMLMPGLLQVRDYAEAVLSNGSEPTPDALARMIELRVGRQRILAGDEPTRLSVVLEEAVLRRPVGGVKVLRKQLDFLLEMAELDHIEVKVAPIDIGWHPGTAGSFTCFNMPDPYPDVAYVEGIVGRTFLEDENKVRRFRQAYDGLHRTAMDAIKSTRFIQATLKDLT